MVLPWSMMSKNTNSKHPAKKMAGRQITNKSQIQILNSAVVAKGYYGEVG